MKKMNMAFLVLILPPRSYHFRLTAWITRHADKYENTNIQTKKVTEMKFNVHS